jgi:hypothetical protein
MAAVQWVAAANKIPNHFRMWNNRDEVPRPHFAK